MTPADAATMYCDLHAIDSMTRDTHYRLIVIGCTLVQIVLAGLFLNSLSRPMNWSAVYAEDSKGYLLAAEYFMGRDSAPEDTGLLRYRLLSPALPFAASLLGRVLPVAAAFMLINVVLWCAAALVFYELLKQMFDNRQAACGGAVILTTSLPLIEWGLPVMVDAGAYFFSGLVFLLYFQFRRRCLEAALVYGLIIGLGILVKPTLVCLLLFAAGSFFFVDRLWRHGVAVLVVAFGLVANVYWLLGLTPQDFFMYGAPRHRGLVYIVSAAFFCFHWGWLFVMQGFRSQQRYRMYCLVYFAAFAIPYLTFVHNPRLFFVCYPAVIPLIVSGMGRYCEARKSVWPVVVLYAVTSNILTLVHLYVMRTLQIRDISDLQQKIQLLFS